MPNLAWRPPGGSDAYREAHREADTDYDRNSIHHTLGKLPTQAAPGDHTHVVPPGLEVGMVVEWPLGTIGAEYLEYNGQSVLRASYPELFALWGTVFGAVDADHFNVGPATADRFPIGKSGTKAVGAVGGGEALTILSPTQLPSHVHSFPHKHNIDHTHTIAHDHAIDHNHASFNLPGGINFTSTTATGGTAMRVTDVANLTGGGGSSASLPIDVPAFVGTSGASSAANSGASSTSLSGFNDTTNTTATGASDPITLPLPKWYATRKIVRALP